MLNITYGGKEKLVKALASPQLAWGLIHFNYLEQFLYDLEMKMSEQNRNNKRTEIELFIGLSNGYKRLWLLVG